MSNNCDAGRILARHVSTFDAGHLADEVVETTKLSILDTIGVTLAASGLASSAPIVHAFVAEAGGAEESSLLGTNSSRVPAHMAAFANGALAHCLDYDDLDHAIALHPSSSTVPAALALAEAKGGVAGIELLAAVALGNDMATRLGHSIVWKHDWFTTPLFGFFTAAAVSARMLGLDEDKTFNAIGIAFAQAGGTLEMRYSTGSDLAGIYGAWPGQAGVISARLASKGIGGIEHAFEGSRGLFAVYFGGEYDRSALTEELGTRFRGTEVSFKPWPSCGLTHNPIDGVIELMREHSLGPDDIDELTYTTGNANAWALCTPLAERRRPRTAMDARFSIPYSMAVAAAHGDVRLSDFTPAALESANILEMADRVRPIFDERSAQPAPIPTILIGVRTTSGDLYEREVAISYGRAPERPMSAEDVVGKFRESAAFAAAPLSAGKIEAVIEHVMNLDQLDSTSALHEDLTSARQELEVVA